MFEKIRSHGLKLNKSKCQIAVNKLVFLRDVVSRDGIKADPKKVHAISNLPQPTNKTELQKSFGMLNYFIQIYQSNQQIYGNFWRRTRNLYLILKELTLLKLMLLIN